MTIEARPISATTTRIADPGTQAAPVREARLPIERYFTKPEVDPYGELEWELRTASIEGADGKPVFEQKDVEIPKTWSQNATNVVASKYFRGAMRPGDASTGSARTVERERSVKQLIDRVVNQITEWEHRHRGAASVLRLLHPQHRGLHRLDPRLVQDRREDLQGRLRLRHQPLAPAQLQRARHGGRARLRARVLHARGGLRRRHDQVGRQDASRRQDGHPERRPPGHRGVHLVQGEGGAQGVLPGRGGLRRLARRRRLDQHPVPERQQLRPRQRRLHARGPRGRRVADALCHDGRRREDLPREAAPARHRAGSVGLRRPRHAVRHDDQRLAHCTWTTAPATWRR